MGPECLLSRPRSASFLTGLPRFPEETPLLAKLVGAGPWGHRDRVQRLTPADFASMGADWVVVMALLRLRNPHAAATGPAHGKGRGRRSALRVSPCPTPEQASAALRGAPHRGPCGTPQPFPPPHRCWNQSVFWAGGRSRFRGGGDSRRRARCPVRSFGLGLVQLHVCQVSWPWHSRNRRAGAGCRTESSPAFSATLSPWGLPPGGSRPSWREQMTSA